MPRSRSTLLGLTALAIGLLAASCGRREVAPGPWPQWRGPGGLGIADDQLLPDEWGADGAGVRWATELPGQGNSSPIVSGGRVFLTAASESADGQVERSVLALDFDGGALLWQTTVASTPPEHKHRANTRAAPTPAADGNAVFAFFGGVLAAVDRDGALLWQREVDPRYPLDSHYGAASSPVLTERAVIVARDRETTKEPLGWMGAFDKTTGDELWRIEWTDTCCSYSSPFLLERPSGAQELLFVHAGRLTAYAPDTGERLWSQELHYYQPVTSPVAAGDLVAVFSGADRTRNGAVLRLAGEGVDTRVEILWQTKRMIPQVSSPLLYRGLLFTVVDQGVIVCYDPETGDKKWQQRLPMGGYKASLVAAGGKIYAVSDQGVTSVIAAEPRYRLIAQNELGEGGNSSPAVADGCLLVRTHTRLVCIGGDGAA